MLRTKLDMDRAENRYLNDIETVLIKCFTVTKPTGSLWLVVDDYREDGVLQLLPWELSQRATKAGWILRDLVVWDKQHTIPWALKGHMRKVTEFILFFTKTDEYKYYIDRIRVLDEVSKWWVDFPERFNPKGKTPTNIWHIPIRTQGTWPLPSKIDHHCPFPTALATRIIELTTDPGDLVLDPFAGSGISLAQAEAMGRNFVGFEINKKYVRMFERTVRNRIRDEWVEMQKWREKQDKARANFESSVMKLRALKFARQVTKPFLSLKREISSDNLRLILCLASIPRRYNQSHRLNLRVWIVVRKHSSGLERALQKAIKLESHPPLSQFGVDAEVRLMTIPSLRRKTQLLESEFYLYPTYRPRKFTASGRLRDWLSVKATEEIRNPKVRLLANIAVDVAYVP